MPPLNHKTAKISFLILAGILIGIHLMIGIHWAWFFVPPGLLLLVVAYGSTQIESNYHLKAYCDGPGDKKEVAITFDDGPVPEFTPEVLALLDEYKVPATFFCIGNQLEKEPELAKKIDEAGHVIGNHSYSHSDFFNIYSTKRVTEELSQTNALITQITGKSPLLFRPPYGVTNPRLRKATEALGLEVMGWNLRSFDTAIKEEKKIIDRIMGRLKPGTIILVHDSHPRIAAVLKEILPRIIDQGYKIVPLAQLLNIKAYD